MTNFPWGIAIILALGAGATNAAMVSRQTELENELQTLRELAKWRGKQ